jgi:hypothetical protein
MAFLSSTVSALSTSMEGIPEDVKSELELVIVKINEIIAKAGPGS